jgi:hypothetical protein
MTLTKLTKGTKYNVAKLVLECWVDGKTILRDTDGYSVFAYFTADGEYLGPDCDGVEPTFEPKSVELA